MQVMRQIPIGILICAACFISYDEAASLSMLMSGSQRNSAIGQHSRSIESMSSSEFNNLFSISCTLFHFMECDQHWGIKPYQVCSKHQFNGA